MPGEHQQRGRARRKNCRSPRTPDPTHQDAADRVSHHRSLKTRSANASTVQIIRASGHEAEDVGEPREGRFRMDQGDDPGRARRPPKMAHTHLLAPLQDGQEASANTRNMIPVGTATVTTTRRRLQHHERDDDQNTPRTSSTHQ